MAATSLKCEKCNIVNDPGERYCASCSEYLAVAPGAAHRDLLQLSAEDFLTTVAEGLPLILDNAKRLWAEASLASQAGAERGACILQAFAEEEAAKGLLLLDSLRCPTSMRENYLRLLKGFDQHVPKGVYVRYYITSPADMVEVRRIVDNYRQGFAREGEYGEYILPNEITTSRESQLYVSYVRYDDGSHHWSSPREPFHFSFHNQSNLIQLLEAFRHAGLFEPKALRVFREYWQAFPFEDIGDDPMSDALYSSIRWPQLTKLNLDMLQILEQRGQLKPECSQEDAETICHYLLFPLYAFDLAESRNFRDLPPPDSPYDDYH
jgi:AbiV family abortive infection protein